jgi:hypothetical protein
MKKITYSLFFVLLSNLFFSAACKKAAPATINDSETTTMSVEFDNIVGGQNLALNSGIYRNASGEEFSVSLLQYFVSNIQLRKTDGTYYTLEQDSSYFLIKEGDAANRFARFKVPPGDYNQLVFMLGVDSLRSTMDITKRIGALDPSGTHESGMYWGWNSGYIFFKMEGNSSAAPADPTGQRKYRYHIGGFGGYSAPTINNIKKITIDLTASGIVKPRLGRKANVHLLVDVLKVFNGTTTLSIALNPTVMFSAYSVNIANNYTAMFTHDHTEN